MSISSYANSESPAKRKDTHGIQSSTSFFSITFTSRRALPPAPSVAFLDVPHVYGRILAVCFHGNGTPAFVLHRAGKANWKKGMLPSPSHAAARSAPLAVIMALP